MLFVVVGLTGARWWQNHKAQQEEITTMADQSSAELNAGKEGAQNVPLDTSAAAGQDTPPAPDDGAVADAAPTPDVAATPAPAADAQQNAVVAPSQANVETATAPATAAPLPTDQAGVTTPAADPNALVMNFTADCWLEVTDATGKNCSAGCSVKTAI